MIKPSVLEPKPSRLLTLLGGVVGMIVMSALIYLAPVVGFPVVDLPLLIGGIFTGDSQAAFWLGYWVFFLLGVFAFAGVLGTVWPMLPGHRTSFPGAAAKGVLWGLLLWVAHGLLLPLYGVLNQVGGLENPGFFATALGVLGMLALLVQHLAFGLAVALVAAMGRGIEPIDTLGWPGYGYGSVHDFAFEEDRRRARGALDAPIVPAEHPSLERDSS